MTALRWFLAGVGTCVLLDAVLVLGFLWYLSPGREWVGPVNPKMAPRRGDWAPDYEVPVEMPKVTARRESLGLAIGVGLLFGLWWMYGR